MKLTSDKKISVKKSSNYRGLSLIFGARIDRKKYLKSAYSLIELSIVIVIVSILISGGLSIATSSASNKKNQLTKDRITEIYKAMGVYLINHKSLPCPAPITSIKSSDANYGNATGTDGNCVVTGVTTRGTGLVYGMVPVQNLGLNSVYAEDGFGGKFTYVVAQAFTNPDNATGFSVATETGLITIKDRIDDNTLQTTTSDAIFVLVSYGVNKFGAYNTNSATQNGTSTDAEEQLNYGTTKEFAASSITSDTFDDILLYKSRNDLVADFDALDLIFCRGTPNGDQMLADGITHTWPTSRYNQVVPANQDCGSGYLIRNSRPLKRCGAFGAWEADVLISCSNS